VTHHPDFIIIGAMKCATTTLHAQLARQRGVFMSTPKEPNFFSDEAIFARGMAWYESLFAAAPPGSIRGESSTHYTKLPTYPDAWKRIRLHLPASMKFIYIMRDPCERLLSHYMHGWSQGEIRVPLDRALHRHRELIDYGRYAMQLEPWREHFGSESILPVFFERLTAQPQAELERVARFLGIGGSVIWAPERSQENVSAQRLRRSRVRDVLLNTPGCRALRRMLVPRAMRDRLKRLWQMEHRPQLSAAQRAEVTSLFNEDLARLGTWIGRPDLRCDTFASIAALPMEGWSVAPAAGGKAA